MGQDCRQRSTYDRLVPETMNWLLLSRMLGLLGMLVGGSMVFSLPWAFPICGQTPAFETSGFRGTFVAILCSLFIGGGLYWIGRKETGSILRKEALATVGLGWILAGVLGSLPFLFSGTERSPGVRLSVADALFESVSGFTTTGATVLTQLEDHGRSVQETASRDAAGSPSGETGKLVPRCILFWRSFTHWLGGMGIIVLFVAVLGHLGAGGKALMRREVPGPISENVRPRVRETAVVMWVIYMLISFVLTSILMCEGMSLYDALCHTFGTMATGGFSTYNASIGHFQSPLIEATLVLFMGLAGTNFSLYYLCLRKQDTNASRGIFARMAPLFRDPEFRLYLCILATAILLLTATLILNRNYATFATAARHATFTTVAIMTTTGYGTEDFTQWSEFAKGLLLLLMFIGGCAGSTGGGIKVVRFLLFAKIVLLEIEQAFRPNVVRPLRIAGVTLDKSLRHEVVVYFSLILLVFLSGWMILVAIEPVAQWQKEGHSESEKLIDCASAVAASLNNIGPGLGVLGPHGNYAEFSEQGKLLLALLMLMGRLELFAILVLLVPSFWRSQ